MTKEILKKIHIILIIFAIVIAGLQVNSFAADSSCTLIIEQDKTQAKVGEKVTFTIKASDIKSGALILYQNILEYDENMFNVSAEGNSSGNWGALQASKECFAFYVIDQEGTTNDQEIGKLVFTVKEGATLGTQTIKITENEFGVYDEDSTYTVADVSKTIEIIADDGTNDDGTNDDGTNDDGTNDDGTNDDGTNDDGTNDDGTNDDGTNDDGTNDDGINDDGTDDDGTNDDDANDDEATDDENKSNTNTDANSSKENNVANNQNTGTTNNSLPKTGKIPNYLFGAIIGSVIIAIGFYIKYRRAY